MTTYTVQVNGRSQLCVELPDGDPQELESAARAALVNHGRISPNADTHRFIIKGKKINVLVRAWRQEVTTKPADQSENGSRESSTNG